MLKIDYSIKTSILLLTKNRIQFKLNIHTYVLVPPDKLTSGNAAVGVVNSLSSMIGMAVAGIVYGKFGLFPILAASAVCFAVTAVMDLLIRIPFKKQIASGSIAQIIKSDVYQSVRFMFKEKPILAKGSVIIFLIVFLLVSILMVGLPVLINQHLKLGMEYVGINQSIMMIGGLAGGIAAGALGSRLTISKSLLVLAIGSIFIVSMGLVFLFDTPVLIAYIIMTAAGALVFFSMQLFQIAAITFVQAETPIELVGKVLSVIMVLPFLAQAAGQVLYGVLFEYFESSPWIVIFATAFAYAVIAICSWRYFRD